MENLNFEKYYKVHNEVMDRLESGELTIEQAKEINDMAFDRYLMENKFTDAAKKVASSAKKVVNTATDKVKNSLSADELAKPATTPEQEKEIKEHIKKENEKAKAKLINTSGKKYNEILAFAKANPKFSGGDLYKAAKAYDDFKKKPDSYLYTSPYDYEMEVDNIIEKINKAHQRVQLYKQHDDKK